uniref:Uncharacterized protein n=1 Tax=Plectus sambesii TaxID=2011161 RepID=A0A914ULU8_9BILA
MEPVIVYCCRDRVDNVLELSDCGQENSIVRFKNLKIFTYGNNKTPSCFQRGASVEFPGYITVSSGQIVVNETLVLNNNASLYFTLRKNDFFVNNVCKKGVSSHFAMPRRYCKPDLCTALGADFCALVGNKGVHDLDTLQISRQQFIRTDISDPFAKLLLRGEWKGEIQLFYINDFIGCLAFPPNQRQWIRVNH